MLALVVLESLREAKPRIAKTHIRAVVSAAGDAIESEHGENLKRRIVDCARRPRVAGQLTARTVVRLRAENPGAGRVDLPIVSDYVADDVVGECRHDVVAGCVKSLREMRRAVESFLLTGVRNEDHRCFETAREMLREYARELHDGRSARPIVVGAGRILRRLESRQRPKISARADARIVMAAHHQHSRSVPARQPGDHIDDIDHRVLWVTAHLHHCRIVLDAKTSATRPAVSLQLAEQIPARRANSPGVAQRIAHRVAGAEGNERRVRCPDLRGRDVSDGGNERRIADEAERHIGCNCGSHGHGTDRVHDADVSRPDLGRRRRRTRCSDQNNGGEKAERASWHVILSE